MSESATINLATVGTAELESMSVQVFTSCLDKMSGDAIARFRRMRKLSSHHRQALEKYLVEHPGKRPGGPGEQAEAPSPVKSGKPAGTANRSPFPDFKLRLRAWWEGISVSELALLDAARAKGAAAKSQPAKKTEAPAPARKPAANAEAAAPEPAKAPAADAGMLPPAEAAPLNRIQIIQTLWGEGFHLPGGEDFALRLAEGASLASGKPCLDLSAGLGGPSRALAHAHHVTVEGIEADPELAAAAQALSEKCGFGQTAPVRCARAETEKFDDGRYQAIFARELLFKAANRKRLLSKLRRSLAPGGSLVITDFALSADEVNDPAFAAWRSSEPGNPLPAKIDEYGELLAELKFDVNDFEDLTEEYLPLIQAGWKRLHNCLQSAKLPPETATMLMREGNLWLARSRALESGRLRLLHFTAHPQEGSKRGADETAV
ncbi:MAG TPA: methyltransferase domain-containing protein [Parvibaculum sp.]